MSKLPLKTLKSLSLSLITNTKNKKSANMASTLTQNLFPKPLNPKTLNPARPVTRILSTRSISSSSLDKKYKTRLSLNINNAHVKSSSYDYNNNNGFNGQQYEYEQGLMGNGPVYPRPTEIQWKKELCNCVQLIGNVGNTVELKQFSSGKVVASCRLAVRKSATDTTWITLTFWDELAHIASQHVEKGQQIYVSGRLIADTVDSDDGKQQTYYKVVVQQLNFVEKSSPPPASNDGGFNYSSNSSSMTTGRKQNYNTNTTGLIEELWQAYFANPDEWWDNRKNKRSPKHPDFKHKDTGEALWVEGRYNPSWVESQLSVLDSRRESFHNQNANMRSNSMFGDNLAPY